MARLSRGRDHALLGHDHRDPFASAGASPYPQYRLSDVDFSDVFGGPPRRSSIGRTGLGPGDSAGGWGGGAGEDEATAPRRPWSCTLGEMPVFGGTESPARRSRPEGGGFFDDVFRANESGCSSPRKVDRDVFSSNSSSRVLSPARPLPPSSEVFVPGSALPAQLSFSTRPSKVSDFPAYGSHGQDVAYRNVLGSSPVASVPASYRGLVQTRDNPKSDANVSFSKGALLHETHHSSHRSLEATKISSIEISDPVKQLKKDSSGVRTQGDYGYFHFSMHKWASLGVTLVSSYNLRGTKSGTKSGGVPIQLPQSADSPSHKCMPQGPGNLHAQRDLEEKSQLSRPVSEGHSENLMREVKNSIPTSPDTGSVRSHTTDKSGDIETRSKDGAATSVKAQKPEPKHLSQLLDNFSDKEGGKQSTGQTRNNESVVVDHNTKMDGVPGTANVEQATSENMFGHHRGKHVNKMHDTLEDREDKIVGSRVKGKVREFIKIFNHEPAPRPDQSIEKQARKPRPRNEARECPHTSVADADEHEEEKINNETLVASPMAGNQNLDIGDVPVSDKIFGMQKLDDPSSEVKGASHDQIPTTLDASFSDIEETYIENIDHCLVEDNQNEVTEADVHQDEVKKSDAKIRDWSRGKEGNIRSLLSTLQYVLWPGSGWKPVPLVDIIEGASVRKAYQKALLCLHPDKLQQKGAEMHQKYIAEKVFDILQEAWIHFNSVSSL